MSTKTVKKTTTKEAVRRIQKFMAKHFGRFVEVPKLTSSRYELIQSIVIDPSTLGPFGFAIESMTVEVKASVHPETGEPWLILDYSYDHSNGGRNAYRTTLESV